VEITDVELAPEQPDSHVTWYAIQARFEKDDEVTGAELEPAA
jgi:hypothetical protein